MFLLPPPEGLEALTQQLKDAYSGVTASANSLFDAIGLTPILEATRMDPATQLAVGSAIGVPPSPRLGMLSRYRALRESPLWSTMPREQQLQALRGQPTYSPELRQVLPKAGGYRAAENQMINNIGRDSRSNLLLQDWNRSKLGYLRDLLQGGQKSVTDLPGPVNPGAPSGLGKAIGGAVSRYAAYKAKSELKEGLSDMKRTLEEEGYW